MNGEGENGRSLRARIAGGAEDKLGRALTDLLENPLLNGAIGKAFDARERAAHAQELAMGALNIPSAADIERLTRRLRSVSQRLEGIEDGVQRLERATGQRLSAIEEQLTSLAGELESAAKSSGATRTSGRRQTGKSPARKSSGAARSSSGTRARKPKSGGEES